MREKEVKEFIGKANWPAFIFWMRGQTCGSYPNGEANFYKHDVDAFKTKLATGYDRQKEPLAWD